MLLLGHLVPKIWISSLTRHAMKTKIKSIEKKLQEAVTQKIPKIEIFRDQTKVLYFKNKTADKKWGERKMYFSDIKIWFVYTAIKRSLKGAKFSGIGISLRRFDAETKKEKPEVMSSPNSFRYDVVQHGGRIQTCYEFCKTFCCTSLPLSNTRWVRTTFSSLCPLSSIKHCS